MNFARQAIRISCRWNFLALSCCLGCLQGCDRPRTTVEESHSNRLDGQARAEHLSATDNSDESTASGVIGVALPASAPVPVLTRRPTELPAATEKSDGEEPAPQPKLPDDDSQSPPTSSEAPAGPGAPAAASSSDE